MSASPTVIVPVEELKRLQERAALADKTQQTLAQIRAAIESPAKPVDRVAVVMLLLHAAAESDAPGYAAADDLARAEDFGRRIEVSRNTALDIMQRLDAVGIVQRETIRSAENRYGEEIPRGAVDLSRGDKFVNTPVMGVAKLTPDEIAAKLAQTAETKTERRARDAQRAARTRDLAKIGQQLLDTACPECGTVGEWHLTCGACGSTWTAAELTEFAPPTGAAESAAPHPCQKLDCNDSYSPISDAPEETLRWGVPDTTSDDVLTSGDTLDYLANLGAQFTLAEKRGKAVYEVDWQNKPHTLAEAKAHLAKGGNVGVLSGQGGVVLLDGDKRFERFALHDERLARASIVYRDDALPERGKVFIRCSDPHNLKSRKIKADPRVKDAPPVMEVFSFGVQAIVAGIHASGATIKLWRREVVTMTAAEIDALVDAWMDANYPNWRPLSVSPPCPAQSVAAVKPTGNQVRDAIAWKVGQASLQAEVDSLLAQCKRKGHYVSIRADDRTPSTRRTDTRDGFHKRTWRDYGTGETLDDYELWCRLTNTNKRTHKWQVVNEWRASQGLPALRLRP